MQAAAGASCWQQTLPSCSRLVRAAVVAAGPSSAIASSASSRLAHSLHRLDWRRAEACCRISSSGRVPSAAGNPSDGFTADEASPAVAPGASGLPCCLQCLPACHRPGRQLMLSCRCAVPRCVVAGSDRGAGAVLCAGPAPGFLRLPKPLAVRRCAATATVPGADVWLA